MLNLMQEPWFSRKTVREPHTQLWIKISKKERNKKKETPTLDVKQAEISSVRQLDLNTPAFLLHKS